MKYKKLLFTCSSLIYITIKLISILILSGFFAKHLLQYMSNLLVWTLSNIYEISLSFPELDINNVTIILVIFFTLLIAYVIQSTIPDPLQKYLIKKSIAGC